MRTFFMSFSLFFFPPSLRYYIFDRSTVQSIMYCCEDLWRNMEFNYKSKWLFSLWKAEITCASVTLLLSAISEQIRIVNRSSQDLDCTSIGMLVCLLGDSIILYFCLKQLFLSSQILWNDWKFNRTRDIWKTGNVYSPNHGNHGEFITFGRLVQLVTGQTSALHDSNSVLF